MIRIQILRKHLTLHSSVERPTQGLSFHDSSLNSEGHNPTSPQICQDTNSSICNRFVRVISPLATESFDSLNISLAGRMISPARIDDGLNLKEVGRSDPQSASRSIAKNLRKILKLRAGDDASIKGAVG